MADIITCPHCGTRLRTTASLYGLELPCPGCSKPIQVPDPSEARVYEESQIRALPPRRKKLKSKKPKQKTEPRETNESPVEKKAITTRLDAIRSRLPESRTLLVAGIGMMLCGVGAWWFISGGGTHQELTAQNDTIDADDPHGDHEEDHGIEAGAHDNQTIAVAETPHKTAGDEHQSEAEDIARDAAEDAAPTMTKAEMIAFLKAATAFVKVKSDKVEQSGSGFFLESENGQVFVITNAHVVTPEEGKLKEIVCVFHSGSKEEFSVTAQIEGQDDAADLAVLSVRHKNLPKALKPLQDVDLFETKPVLVLGFPFGEALTTSKRNPDITVSKGTISSIRRDDFGQIAILQIDGGINQGNSGGPVVTENGTLVGVSVAKVRGTEIGLAIPQHILRGAIQGRVATVTMTTISQTSGGEVYRASVTIMDPRNNIASARMLTCDADQQKSKTPEANGRWSRISNQMTETPLKISGRKGQAVVRVPHKNAGSVFQIAWTLKDGTERVTAPIDFRKAVAAGKISSETGLAEAIELPEADGNKVVLLPSTMSDFAIDPELPL